MKSSDNKIEETLGPFAFASMRQRILAYLIDSVLLYLVLSVFLVSMASFTDPVPSLEVAGIENMSPETARILGAVYAMGNSLPFAFLLVGVQMFYQSLFLVTQGQTLGMQILKIGVVTLDYRRMSWRKALVRALSFELVSVLYYLPLLIPVRSFYNQRVHDMISQSVVVDIRAQEELMETQGQMRDKARLEPEDVVSEDAALDE